MPLTALAVSAERRTREAGSGGRRECACALGRLVAFCPNHCKQAEAGAGWEWGARGRLGAKRRRRLRWLRRHREREEEAAAAGAGCRAAAGTGQWRAAVACGGRGGAPRVPGEPSPHPPRSGVCQAACGAGGSPRAERELGVGGVAAPSAGSSRAGFSPVLAPLPVVSPPCRPGLPRGIRICDLVLSGSGGGESGTGPLPT